MNRDEFRNSVDAINQKSAVMDEYDRLTTERNSLLIRVANLESAVSEITEQRLHQSLEINRLTRVENELVNQIALMRKALEWIANSDGERHYTTGEGHSNCIYKARAALEVK